MTRNSQSKFFITEKSNWSILIFYDIRCCVDATLISVMVNTIEQKYEIREVVVAQLAERSLTIPEDPGSIPVIGNFY